MKELWNKNKYRLIALGIILGLWWAASRIYPPLIVPGIGKVFECIGRILIDRKMLVELLRTVERLAIGLAIGMVTGCILGFFAGISRIFRQICKPIIDIIQVVPPVSWLVLAIIWFGYNGRASIFIVLMAIIPAMFICTADGIRGIDRKNLEMAKVFELSFSKKLRFIMIPSVIPSFMSGFRISLGTACKTVVMGEVLTTASGIGGQIMKSRMNIEPENLIAWTIILVGIYYIASGASRLISGRKGSNNGKPVRS